MNFTFQGKESPVFMMDRCSHLVRQKFTAKSKQLKLNLTPEEATIMVALGEHGVQRVGSLPQPARRAAQPRRQSRGGRRARRRRGRLV